MSSRVLLTSILTFIAFLPLHAENSSPHWVELEHCILSKSDYSDGDSFHVSCAGRNYHFRLYFVDCPETDTRIPERNAMQAHFFGIAAKEIINAGEKAHAFTRQFLSADFKVWTKWEDARGDSKQQRFYAIVLVKNKNLANELVRHGLARVYGKPTDFPDSARCWEYRRELKQLEKQARSQSLGAFSH
jgi:endonuclease YncB( thermonuclease family)